MLFHRAHFGYGLLLVDGKNLRPHRRRQGAGIAGRTHYQVHGVGRPLLQFYGQTEAFEQDCHIRNVQCGSCMWCMGVFQCMR